MSLMGLLMASYGRLLGILSGLTNSTDHPSRLCYVARICRYIYIPFNVAPICPHIYIPFKGPPLKDTQGFQWGNLNTSSAEVPAFPPRSCAARLQLSKRTAWLLSTCSTCISVRACASVHVCKHIHIYIHIGMYIYIYTHTPLSLSIFLFSLSLSLSLCLSLYLSLHTHTYTCTHIYV